MTKRIEWIDQLKGLGIFLVIYGHNFPITEKYIYSFHVPLFFMIAGFFHPTKQHINSVVKRAKSILIPYFIWSFLLFLFWLFLGRFYGESLEHNLSVLKNFIGIFYAQGDRDYMDWGIPMWFLPTVFLSHLIFYLINYIKNRYLHFFVIIIIIIIGFLLPHFSNIKYLWSIDVALVSLSFYTFGYFSKNSILRLSKLNAWVLFLIFGIIHFSLFNFNDKIDMYRSVYGNEFLFILNALSGTMFYLLLFKNITIFNFFGFLGKFTIPILALQIRALTFIKLLILTFAGVKIFNFTEVEKFIISIIQILILIPILIIINKYIPLLNGNHKKI